MQSKETTAPLQYIEAERKPRLRSVMVWLGCLWLVGWLGICIEQTISWTDSGQGFLNGAVVGGLLSPFSLILFIPVGAVGWAIGSLKWFRPFRWWISMAFPFALSVSMVVPRVMDRVCPARRFERFTGVHFPRSATHLEIYTMGGLFVDFTDSYDLRCSSSETDRLIRELELERQKLLDSSILGDPGGGFSPASKGWSVPERYRPVRTRKVGRTDFLELFTDQSHTRVHITYGTI